MKSFGILLATIFIFSCISLSADDNDNNRKKTTMPYGWGFYCMCAGEWLEVEGELIAMEQKNKMQWTFKGIAVGGTTGWEYDVHLVENLVQKANKGYAGTYNWNIIITLDGDLVARITRKQHITVNANGEMTVDRLVGPYPYCGD